jgi:hypothetical protein
MLYELRVKCHGVRKSYKRVGENSTNTRQVREERTQKNSKEEEEEEEAVKQKQQGWKK